MKLELKRIRAQRDLWLRAVNENDIHEMATVLSEDAVWIPPRMPAVNSRNAIVEWMTPFFETYDYTFSIDNLHIKAAGNWAVEQSDFTSTLEPKGGGDKSTHRGRYIIIWRWEPDNEWRIERYVDDSPDLD